MSEMAKDETKLLVEIIKALVGINTEDARSAYLYGTIPKEGASAGEDEQKIHLGCPNCETKYSASMKKLAQRKRRIKNE